MQIKNAVANDAACQNKYSLMLKLALLAPVITNAIARNV
jgi:hypothetical protein